MAKKKYQRNWLERKLDEYNHTMELIRTILPFLILLLQIYILTKLINTSSNIRYNSIMTLLFLSLAGIIAIIVILVSAKFIKAGFDARGEVKEEQRKEKLKQEDEDILDELKRKDLSEEDLKDLYDKIQNKKKDDNE